MGRPMAARTCRGGQLRLYDLSQKAGIASVFSVTALPTASQGAAALITMLPDGGGAAGQPAAATRHGWLAVGALVVELVNPVDTQKLARDLAASAQPLTPGVRAAIRRDRRLAQHHGGRGRRPT